MKEKLDEFRMRKARAERHKRAFEVDGVKAALEEVEKFWTESWNNTKPEDAAGRELAWCGRQSVKFMKQYYLSIIADGKAADAERRVLERQMKGKT